ncbi:NADP-dependent oxidoreductase [Nakamurella aerolata]|uniref:NADP-dependent oxidoreductase n=1 Tax=Nakamurella aerolata TaxID=1656892 RepID=A0A849A3G3_9ACTN|nr:NADP-dependent oxidoreductase [Nakamurella aerolata]NNG35095.1 NADP-dependent oxidoreductase [Nakamurella aerolata]
MKAVVARAGRQYAELEESPEPTPAAGEVLVRVGAAAVNPADLLVEQGVLREPFGLPDVVGDGYDFAGEVAALGAGVTDLAVGDRVAGLAADLSRKPRAHADIVAVPRDSVAPVPRGLELTAAATVPLTALTADQALDDLGDPAGRSLLITGAAGGVGGFAVRLAADRGWQVSALARPTDKDFVIGAGATDLLTTLPRAEFDVVFDAAGLQETALAAVRDGGRFHGVMPVAVPTSERGIETSAVLVQPDAARLAELLELVADGRLTVRIAGTVPLKDFRTAYDALASGGQRGRWLLRP